MYAHVCTYVYTHVIVARPRHDCLVAIQSCLGLATINFCHPFYMTLEWYSHLLVVRSE